VESEERHQRDQQKAVFQHAAFGGRAVNARARRAVDWQSSARRLRFPCR
jgi:hypothetical protein